MPFLDDVYTVSVANTKTHICRNLICYDFLPHLDVRDCVLNHTHDFWHLNKDQKPIKGRSAGQKHKRRR